MPEDHQPATEHWTVDKKVPVALFGAVVLQTLGLVWYASKLDTRVEQLESADRRNEIRYEALRNDRERLIKIETQVDNIGSVLKRLETKLDGSNGR